VRFAVWAPNAKYVSVIGDFNDWDSSKDQLQPVDSTGIWEGIVESATVGQHYKYHLDGREKADPVAFEAEVPPKTASVIFESEHEWQDAGWIESRHSQEQLEQPMTIYELHAPSWRRGPDGSGLGWRELADQLAPYIRDLGFTHVELLPVMHHPYAGSWGYQVTGFYATVSTMGSPDDFRYFVDHMHANGIGVLLDWVPAHFATDPWALARFDGTALYEHDDPRRGEHPDWGTYVFNLGRAEVQNFLLANALFWLREYHVDGLRVDAVASMLYLDYSRKDGEWVPNAFGGREDLDAVAFLKEFNELVHAREPGAISAAEESTAWPGVSRPTYVGGLGFGFKWNMGWMHDTLSYFQHDPIHRRFHHHELTFSLVYAWNENFILPLSHDEVVHGKGSLLSKMPGDRWQQLANLRALYAYMWSHPGKKLLFMGQEIATPWEWNHADEVPWQLLEHPEHAGMRDLVRDLNRIYRDEPAFWEVDFSHEGFRWIEPNDAMNNVLVFARVSKDGERQVVCIANLAPVPREGYRVGLPLGGDWTELLNTDSAYYGGTGVGNLGKVTAAETPWHDQPFSAVLTLPPLAVMWLQPAVLATP
jgi:1,4-alpha-glucan branching enzyme